MPPLAQTDHSRPAEDAPAGAPVVDGYAHPGFTWVSDIACKEATLLSRFAQAGHVLSEEARAECMSCPVWEQCLIFSYLGAPEGKAITGGYFGGFSPGQRKKLSLDQALELGREQRAAEQSA